MTFFDLSLIGEVIRNYRKERGLRLEDLADENISVSTISNIERGFAHVKEEKVDYLLKKLGLDMDELSQLEYHQQKKDQQLALELKAIESWISCEEYEKALEALQKIHISDTHHLSGWLHYLRGKCFLAKEDWKKAQQAFQEAIRLSKANQFKANMEALCMNELSQCFYRQNQLEQALSFVEKGLMAFREDEERSYVKYHLMLNKIVYLRELDRESEAMKLVQHLWEHMAEINNCHLILKLYLQRVELLEQALLYDDALRYADEGIEIARLNRQYDYLCELWTQMGKVFARLDDLNFAEACFNTAVTLEYQVERRQVLVTTYTHLGHLLMKKQKYQEAEMMLEKAIKLGEKTKDYPRLISAFIQMGECKCEQGNEQEAIEYFIKARDLAHEHELPKQEYESIFCLAKIYKQSDQDEFIACTIQMYELQSAWKK